MADLLVEYYTDLFTSSQPSEIDAVLQHVSKVVTEEMNAPNFFPTLLGGDW